MSPATFSTFDFQPHTRLVFGAGSVDRVGQFARECGGTRVLLVTDPGLVRAGHADRVEASLRGANLEVARFDQACENPTTGVVERCAELARSASVDLLVGLGGGSSMDTAKGCNFLLTQGGRMEDYWGVGKAIHPMLPLVAVPTTAGTGSECQSFALIAQEETHVKMACGDAKAAPRVALLDPELTLTQPAGVAAAAGIDAMAHAVESAVTRRRNPISSMFSREAFALVATGLETALAHPDDIEARGRMLLGAALAGLAIENSMLGAAHAAANPLTARFGAAHGQAVGLMLPAVVRYNATDTDSAAIYQELALIAGLIESRNDPSHDALALADFLEDSLAVAALPRSLCRWNVHASDLEVLAEDAAGQWTAGFNPRPVNRRDFLRLYQSVACTSG